MQIYTTARAASLKVGSDPSIGFLSRLVRAGTYAMSRAVCLELAVAHANEMQVAYAWSHTG